MVRILLFIDSFAVSFSLLYIEKVQKNPSWSIDWQSSLAFRMTRTAAEQKANDAQFSFVIPHYSIHGGDGMAAINCCCHLHAIHNPREGESLRRVLPKICPRWWDKKQMKQQGNGETRDLLGVEQSEREGQLAKLSSLIPFTLSQSQVWHIL